MPARAKCMFPVSVETPLTGSYNSAVTPALSESEPPANSTRPEGSNVIVAPSRET